MTRPPASLGHHLLTRSDLEQLGIQAERVRTWLASGWIDQVGNLTDGAQGEPVFAVVSRELRDELGCRLLELGKDTVVLTPMRVQSLLVRAARLPRARRPDPAPQPAATDDPVADALLDPAMAAALHQVARSLEDEVELLLDLVREEARLEALEHATHTAAEASFFDAAELEEELGLWEPCEAPGVPAEPAPELVPTTRPSLPPTAADLLAAAPATDLREEETMSEPSLHHQEAPAGERSAQDALDALFGPTEPANTREPSTPSETAAATSMDALEVDLPPLDPAPSVESEFLETAEVADVLPVSEEEQPESQLQEDEPATTDEVLPIAPTEADACAETTSMLAMQKVESFLGELRSVLVELAQRPAPPPIDVQPLVQAVHQGFADLNSHAQTSDKALAAVTDRLGQFGDKLEHGAALAVHAALGAHGVQSQPAAPSAAASPAPTPPTFVVERADRSTAALYAIGFLLLCWSGILWFKTGNAQLALATLVGANLIGCCVLIGRARA
jgi:hypothetical protein